MTTTTPITGHTARTLLADIATGFHLIVSHISDLANGVSSARKAMQMHDLSDAELDELGITRDEIVAYAFREKT